MRVRAKNNKTYIIERFSGHECTEYLDIIANFRIEYFKQYPYLYKGNLEYERNYLSEFIVNKESLIILVKNEERDIIAVSTSLPLTSEADILNNASEVFKEFNQLPQDYFYFSEVIIDNCHQGAGLLRYIYSEQEKYARNLGYFKVCIATVIRDSNDPRRPTKYYDQDKVWKQRGFSKTKMSFKHCWPTIMPDGSVSNFLNSMIFWIKDI